MADPRGLSSHGPSPRHPSFNDTLRGMGLSVGEVSGPVLPDDNGVYSRTPFHQYIGFDKGLVTPEGPPREYEVPDSRYTVGRGVLYQQLLIEQFHKADSMWARVLPWKKHDGGAIQWSTIRLDSGMMNRRAHLTTSMELTHSFSTEMKSFEHHGIAISAESTFMMSAEGRELWNAKMKALAISVINTANFHTMYALITTPEWKHHSAAQTGGRLPHSQFMQALSMEAANFGLINKTRAGVLLVLDAARQTLTNRGVQINVTILPKGALKFFSRSQECVVSLYKAGSNLANDEPCVNTSQYGTVFESGGVTDPEGGERIDLFFNMAVIGDFAFSSYAYTCNAGANYNTDMRDLTIWSEIANNWVVFKLKSLLLNCGLWRGDHTLTPIGKEFFWESTMEDYLKNIGEYDRIKEAVASKIGVFRTGFSDIIGDIELERPRVFDYPSVGTAALSLPLGLQTTGVETKTDDEKGTRPPAVTTPSDITTDGFGSESSHFITVDGYTMIDGTPIASFSDNVQSGAYGTVAQSAVTALLGIQLAESTPLLANADLAALATYLQSVYSGAEVKEIPKPAGNDPHVNPYTSPQTGCVLFHVGDGKVNRSALGDNLKSFMAKLANIREGHMEAIANLLNVYSLALAADVHTDSSSGNDVVTRTTAAKATLEAAADALKTDGRATMENTIATLKMKKQQRVSVSSSDVDELQKYLSVVKHFYEDYKDPIDSLTAYLYVGETDTKKKNFLDWLLCANYYYTILVGELRRSPSARRMPRGSRTESSNSLIQLLSDLKPGGDAALLPGVWDNSDRFGRYVSSAGQLRDDSKEFLQVMLGMVHTPYKQPSDVVNDVVSRKDGISRSISTYVSRLQDEPRLAGGGEQKLSAMGIAELLLKSIAPGNWIFYATCLSSNVPIPLNFLLLRPSMRFRTGTMVNRHPC